jgi:exo-beta-1,3-glucanase (GH17 family)
MFLRGVKLLRAVTGTRTRSDGKASIYANFTKVRSTNYTVTLSSVNNKINLNHPAKYNSPLLSKSDLSYSNTHTFFQSRQVMWNC